jgi:hypothetical protein
MMWVTRPRVPSVRSFLTGEDALFRGGEVDEVAGVGGAGGEGLVDDDVLAGAEGGGGELGVGGVGGGDDDEVDGGVEEGVFGGAEDRRVRIGGCGGVAGALGYTRQCETGDRGDEGAVEDAAGEAVTDDGGADGGGAHAVDFMPGR